MQHWLRRARPVLPGLPRSYSGMAVRLETFRSLLGAPLPLSGAHPSRQATRSSRVACLVEGTRDSATLNRVGQLLPARCGGFYA